MKRVQKIITVQVKAQITSQYLRGGKIKEKNLAPPLAPLMLMQMVDTCNSTTHRSKHRSFLWLYLCLQVIRLLLQGRLKKTKVT